MAMMAFPSRKETYDSNTPSDLSSRTSMNRALYRRSSKGTTIQSYGGNISNSSVHTTSVAASRRDLFNRPGQGSLHPISHHSESPSGPGNCPTISDHKSSHHLGKSTSTFRNQFPSTETTSYQAPISRPQEPISRPQEPISRSQTAWSHQAPISRPQEPVSRPQEPVSRSRRSQTTRSYQAPSSRPQEPISRPQGPISGSRSQEPVSRPQTTRSYAFEQPIHSRAYSYALNQLPPPAPLSEPNSYLHPAPRRSRTRPPQPHHVMDHTYEAPQGQPIIIHPPSAVMEVAPPTVTVMEAAPPGPKATPTKRPQPLLKRLFANFRTRGFSSSGSSPKFKHPPPRG